MRARAGGVGEVRFEALDDDLFDVHLCDGGAQGRGQDTGGEGR